MKGCLYKRIEEAGGLQDFFLGGMKGGSAGWNPNRGSELSPIVWALRVPWSAHLWPISPPAVENSIQIEGKNVESKGDSER